MILISTATCRLVQDAVRLQALRPVHVQGQAEPVAVYQVLKIEGRRAPVAGLAEHARSQFVGRGRELAVLHDLLQQVEGGQGRIVGIVGEPGMGKSRLLMEFHASVRGRPVTYLAGQCLSYGHAVPYLPVRDLVRAQCGITDADILEAMTAKVRRGLQDVGLDADEAAPYLFQLLGLQEGVEPLALLTSEAIKVRTFELLCQMSRRASQHQPLIMAVEDLHWIDAASEALFAALVESLVGASILFLATYRPGYRPLWVDKSYTTQIALHQLSPQESRTVVHAVAQREPVSAALLQTILTKAEGNPLFIEELTRAVLEQGALRADMPVPETIQGVLMARIDRLPEATKRVLQMASVLGREGTVRVLERLWEGPGDLTLHLQTLKRLEFLYERMEAEESTYVFKHPLIQEVAYDSLLLAQRQLLHAAVGRALEALYADRLEAICGRLAYHYAKTTEAAKAIEYLTRLAEKAARECTHAEAVTALYEALEHLARLPNEFQDRESLALGLRLVDSLHYLGRFTESLDVLQQQQLRLAQHQDASGLGPCHVQLGFTYSMLGDHVRAVQHAHHALTVATHGRDTVTLGRAHYVLALEGYWAGQPQQGMEHGHQAIALLGQTAEWESLGMAYFYVALNLTLLGDFAPALAAIAQAQTLGEALGDPGLQSYAAWLSGWIHTMQGDWAHGIALCQQSLAHSPHPLNTALALSVWGYACLEQGDPVQAISLLEQVVQHTDQAQYQRLLGLVMPLLGEAYGMHGRLDTACDLGRRGLDISQRVTYRPGVGVAQRALGRLAQRSGALAEAERYLQEACATFAAMPARYELGRTHLDLAALGQSRNDLDTAATHLTEAYALFTALRLPQYVARTAQLASVLGVALHRGDQEPG